MDFAALRSCRGGESDHTQDSAAEIISNANPSTLVDNLSGRVAKVARDAAAAVVLLMRNACHEKDDEQREETEARKGNVWQDFNTGLLEVQADLARNAVRSQVFQAQLLLALHRADFGEVETDAGTGENERPTKRAGPRERRRERRPVPLALYWRLHESGLLPMARLLEASEALLSPLALGQQCSGERQQRLFGGSLDATVHDMRALAVRSAQGDPDTRQGDAARILSGVANHLFDLAYRKGSSGSGGPSTTRHTSNAQSSRAARTVLDELCCGAQVFGDEQDRGTEARLRGCLSVISAILPIAASFISPPGSADDESVPGVAISSTGYDGPAAAFLIRQLRLLMESSSENEHTQGEDTEIAGARDANSDSPELLVQILRHFPSVDIIEVLRSICRRAAVRAADRTGFGLHKPLLRWETLGPIVRAAATAYPRDLPPAVALSGTEMAAAAVNFVPSGDANASRTNGCNQPQGVLVLSAALRLVAEADVTSQGTQGRDVEGEDGLYASWVRSFLGVDESAGIAVGPAEVGAAQQEHGEEAQMRDVHPPPSGSEFGAPPGFLAPLSQLLRGVREAMKKQRATDILMEALCLSVPYDPAFVLEVHKDVLKTRLRAKFSVQVRDFVDLVATRLSDLRGRNDAKRRKGVEGGPHYASEMENSFDRDGEGCSDPIAREVGFFLRQFKQTGEVPLALKTAILWQPKSWASFRKVLLAPPAERIAMPDDSGNMRLSSSVVVKEAIGRGENGLRVEVSLKYRRLLVQQLAKESLLSAKDHEAFRKSYVEYLQDQRDEDDAERHGEGESEAGTAVARQLLMLESKLGQIEKGNGQATVEKRLTLLLQEYLPRALVVELCMEEDGQAQCRSPTSTCGRNWFSRATSLLQQILGECSRCFRSKEALPGRGASPEQVAEAVLNSIHCCVAAVAATLLSSRQSSPVYSASGSPGSSTRGTDGEDAEGKEGAYPGESPGMKGMLTLLDLPVARAFQRIGEVVTRSAGTDLLGEALFRRCSSLLSNPNNLDPKQILSLAHSVAGLPPAFHGKVKTFLASLVTKILRSRSSSCEGGRAQPSTEQMARLAGTAQIGALYLQSSLLLHERIWDSVVLCSGDRNRVGAEGHAEEDGCDIATQTRDNMESVGLAPVVILDFCWWMERRLSLAQHSMTADRRNVGMAGLLRLIRGVLNHPLIERALQIAFRARGSAAPPLDRLVSLEMAISNENDFGGASITLMILESATLGRDVGDSTKDAEARRRVRSTNQAGSTQPPDKSVACSAGKVWDECAACLFGNSRLRDSACRRVRRGARPSSGCFVGSEGAVRDWESHFHPAWGDSDADGRLARGSAEGVERVLDAIMQLMGKLCNLEAAAGSVCEKGSGDGSPEQTHNPRESGAQGERRASILLAEVVTLLSRIGFHGAGPALVLVAEITVPAIGAIEGRRKAIESLRLLWEGCFSEMRPLEYGAIDRLMRIALLWYGGRSDEKEGSGDLQGDRMTSMLEDLPVLGGEMVRTWATLRCTLQPVMTSPLTSTDSFARDGWARHLDSLHSAGKKILLDLTEGGVTTATTTSSATRPSVNKSGRVPLGTVKNSMPDQRGNVHAQYRVQSCTAQDLQGDRIPRACSQDGPGVDPCNDHLREAFAALPHTSAQVVVGVLHAAGEGRAKGSPEMPAALRDAKRVKTLTGEPRKPEGFGSTEFCEITLRQGVSACDEAKNINAWVASLLQPVFGSKPAGPAASSLRVLLDTLVCKVGHRRTSTGISNVGDAASGACAEMCKPLGISLAVAILGHVPHLVAGMAEPPCLQTSSSSVSPIERLGRSLAVLNILKMLAAVRPCLNRPVFLIVLLSHYTAALLILVKEHAVGTLLNQRGWLDVVAFVHARVRGVAPQELQKLPAALRLAAQEVDPLLKQYF